MCRSRPLAGGAALLMHNYTATHALICSKSVGEWVSIKNTQKETSFTSTVFFGLNIKKQEKRKS